MSEAIKNDTETVAGQELPALKFTVYGAPITKKNHQQIVKNKYTGKRFIKPSEEYVQYEAKVLWALPKLAEPIDIPVTCKCLFFMPTLRRVDQTNLLQSISDIMVKGGILKDDNCKIIASYDGTRVYLDRDNPRTEITITPFFEETEYQPMY